ncbi:hypothetical protein PL640_25705, partial [Agrobacterium sp. ST15.16.024]
LKYFVACPDFRKQTAVPQIFACPVFLGDLLEGTCHDFVRYRLRYHCNTIDLGENDVTWLDSYSGDLDWSAMAHHSATA